MNYNTDRPIKSCDEDLLGRSSFAKHLGKAIFEYNGDDGLVIGLFGKWGTGKTSVINMAISELDSLSSDEENRPITMRFAPWNYSDKDNLISIFFQNLKNTIEYESNNRTINHTIAVEGFVFYYINYLEYSNAIIPTSHSSNAKAIKIIFFISHREQLVSLYPDLI